MSGAKHVPVELEGDDILKVLRTLHSVNPLLYDHAKPAADEIERLRELNAELLKALQSVARGVEYLYGDRADGALREARAAIAKATGSQA